MKFEKLRITEEQKDKYFSGRQKGLLKRDDVHVYAILEDEAIKSMAMISKDDTFEETYVIHDLYLKEDEDPKYLTELISNIEEVCQSAEAHYLVCRLQGDKVETANYAELFLNQKYHFVNSGYRLYYAVDDLMDSRLIESADEIRPLLKHVKPYSMLTRAEKHELSEVIKTISEYNMKRTVDPEFGLVMLTKEGIVAFMDARKLDEGTIYAPSTYLLKRKYSGYARALIMIYMIEKAKQTMRDDTVIVCESYDENMYQGCMDWFGVPEKEDSIIEMIKII